MFSFFISGGADHAQRIIFRPPITPRCRGGYGLGRSLGMSPAGPGTRRMGMCRHDPRSMTIFRAFRGPSDRKHSNKDAHIKKGRRQAWRKHMRRRFHGDAPRPSPTGGPQLPRPFTWRSLVQGPGTHRMPSTMLHRIHRLLTALETEIGQRSVPESNTRDASQGPHRARLQARLQRLADHIELQKGGHHSRHGQCMHKRSQGLQKSERCENNEVSDEEETAPDDGTNAIGDVTMLKERQGLLEDCREFQEHVEQLQDAKGGSTTPCRWKQLTPSKYDLWILWRVPWHLHQMNMHAYIQVKRRTRSTPIGGRLIKCTFGSIFFVSSLVS